MNNTPSMQQFDVKTAKAAMSERQANGLRFPKNLVRRRKDYDGMIDQRNIGNGWRDANGYTKPGSNKK